ncbi:hypothetical protein MTR67_015947 [Solanum verrucosum]|uniref:Uncharacterized protein n=1 Tax=Solanum verrucosum TaxID=315347 RepID=A0AAF0QGS7_SOLVR|nr:hypothetical protein MTR67_015947 [Solanum verrucosum]
MNLSGCLSSEDDEVLFWEADRAGFGRKSIVQTRGQRSQQDFFLESPRLVIKIERISIILPQLMLVHYGRSCCLHW